MFKRQDSLENKQIEEQIVLMLEGVLKEEGEDDETSDLRENLRLIPRRDKKASTMRVVPSLENSSFTKDNLIFNVPKIFVNDMLYTSTGVNVNSTGTENHSPNIIRNERKSNTINAVKGINHSPMMMGMDNSLIMSNNLSYTGATLSLGTLNNNYNSHSTTVR
jgi:hypothetical protein